MASEVEPSDSAEPATVQSSSPEVRLDDAQTRGRTGHTPDTEPEQPVETPKANTTEAIVKWSNWGSALAHYLLIQDLYLDFAGISPFQLQNA